MGLGKFVAGRIHQRGVAKGYQATHPSWFYQNPNPTCPRGGTEPETFLHAVLTCPARSTSANCISNLIPNSQILIAICAPWDYWPIIICFDFPLFVSGGPLLSARPPLLLSGVDLYTFVALGFSRAQILTLPARACADL